MNNLKKRVLTKTPTYGSWLQFASANVAEAVVASGLPLVLIDNEHAAASLETTLAMMRAAEANGGEVIIRVPSSDPTYLKRIMELGPSGLLVPQVDTAEEAAAAVAACLYPPHGRRGFARLVRASRYGQATNYAKDTHKDFTLMVQIETGEAVANAKAIASVEGVDMLFIGPYDLSGAIDELGATDSPVVLDAIAKVEAVAKATNTALGTVPRANADAKALFDLGYTLVMGTSDTSILRAGLADVTDAVPEHARMIGNT